jgi:hypothetical protein
MVAMVLPAKNPVPTAGDVRDAWSRTFQALQPVLPYLRGGVYFGLGLGVVAMTLRGFRGIRDDQGRSLHVHGSTVTEQGEHVVRTLRANPAITQVAARFTQASSTLAAKAQSGADEAHDTVEEIYGRFDHLTSTLLHAATRMRVRRPRSENRRRQ